MKTRDSYSIRYKNKTISKINYYDYSKKNFDWILVANVKTEPEYRKHGLASKLLDKLYNDTKDTNKGIYLFVKSDNATAISMYKKNGFSFLKKYKLKDGMYDIMCKGNADKKQFNGMNFS